MTDPGDRDDPVSVASGRLAGMILWALADIERAIRFSWAADTCAPEDLPDWHTGNPARGQCGVTALVLNDLLGGDLVRGEVRVNGERVDFHWWNRFAGGLEVDLTREQFAPGELVGPGTVIKRPPSTTRLQEEYETLRSRVLAALNAGADADQLADRQRHQPGSP